MKNFIVTIFNSVILIISMSVSADTADEIVENSMEILDTLYSENDSAVSLGDKAVGILVFPAVLKAGIGIGGEYGEGVLIRKNLPLIFFNTVSASIGFQFGVQKKSQVILFMTQNALDEFLAKNGWEVGIDGSIAIVDVSVAEDINSIVSSSPVIGFVLSNKGLMYNISLEGSKITRIEK